jgi:pyruvate/2-oxoglutarate dehydrogenase complex dihydrolipoamide dehydrogenase (E3) component
VNSCIGCNQACLDRSFTKQPVSCLVNPRAGQELRYPSRLSALPSPSRRRRVAVVGGGPAGLVAAAELAEHGAEVALFEAAEELGGQFRLAARIPTKEDYALTVQHYTARLADAGVRVELGAAAEAGALAGGGFDAVVLATGVRPRPLELPGAELPHVLSYERALTEGVPAGRVVIVGGGGIGVDTAKFLVLSHDPVERAREFERQYALAAPSTFLESDALPQRVRARSSRDSRHGGVAAAGLGRPRLGSDVTLLRRSGKIGAGMGITSRWVALAELREAGVRLESGLEYTRITAEGVEVRRHDGEVELVRGDTVVVCAGQLRHDPLSAQLGARGVPHVVVGGALDAAGVDAVRATQQALAAAHRILA